MLRRILEAAIESGVTPGAAVIVGDVCRDIAEISAGELEPGGAAASVDTIYDVASLTKPIATTAVLMKLCERGAIDLDRAVPDLAPATFRHLVGHAAGYPDHVRFYERLWAGDYAGQPTARAALVAMARQTERVAPPGQRAIYSDVGFTLLGDAIERVAGARLDELTADLVTGPLAMSATTFVDVDAPAAGDRFGGRAVAPTEQCARRGRVRGEVHDENAHAAGGISGHAGLFSTALDVARFARAMCEAWQGSAAVFSPDVVREFFASSAAPDTSWRLGWDTPSATGVSHAGDLWPRTGVGHLGFTGCSMWLDPARGRYVVMLSNRVFAGRDRAGIKELRRDVMDSVVRELYG